MKLTKFSTLTNLSDIFKTLIDTNVLYNPDGLLIGYIESFDILELKSREDVPYSQLQFCVRTNEGKRYTKRLSVEFVRRLFTQLSISVRDSIKLVVTFKVDPKYKKVKWWAFVTEDVLPSSGETIYDIQQYEDSTTLDVPEMLKKLGL